MSQEILAKQLSPSCRLRLMQGDLTEEPVEAIVNAANSQLVHGGGLAAAIVRKGGQHIQDESHAWVQEHGPVPHDRPAVTDAGDLPCRYVIHAVGPVWGVGDEERKLHDAVQGSLQLASELGLKSVAFPAISTGIFRFPKARAARIMFEVIEDFVQEESALNDIRITLLDRPTLDVFVDAFHARWPIARD